MPESDLYDSESVRVNPNFLESLKPKTLGDREREREKERKSQESKKQRREMIIHQLFREIDWPLL